MVLAEVADRLRKEKNAPLMGERVEIAGAKAGNTGRLRTDHRPRTGSSSDPE